MAPIPPIFSIPVPAYKSSTHNAPEGTFTLTQPAPKIYLLSFDSPPDNRLTPPFLKAFSLALDVILTTLPPGVLLTTSTIPKFYSNGLDYGSAIADKNFMNNHLYPVWRKLLTFPWPTVAVINGHCFAGGLMTALAHDYRIMNPHKGFLCLNELDFGAPLSPAMATIFRVKLSMTTFRTLILEGKRFAALPALEAGIVDGVGGVDEAIKIVEDLGIKTKLRDVGKGSYGVIKEEMYREILADLDSTADENRKRDKACANDRVARLDAARKNAEDWKTQQGGKLAGIKPKL